METKFNSQICTTREQSERLLALGIKKETADMCYKVTTHDFKGNEINEKDRHYALCSWYDESCQICGLEQKKTIPAWSLHRLIEMMPQRVSINGYCFPLRTPAVMEAIDSNMDLYDSLIGVIRRCIEEGYFNKEYLNHEN